jgi:hypothetical protein
MKWLNSFKLAVVLEKENEIIALLENIPNNFETKEDILETQALLSLAKKNIQLKKDKILNNMQKIKKNIDYLNDNINNT